MSATDYAQALAADTAANEIESISATDPLSPSRVNRKVPTLHDRSRFKVAQLYIARVPTSQGCFGDLKL